MANDFCGHCSEIHRIGCFDRECRFETHHSWGDVELIRCWQSWTVLWYIIELHENLCSEFLCNFCYSISASMDTIIDSHPPGLIFLTHDCQWHGTVRIVSRLKSLMPFKRVLALQIIPLLKQPFKTQPSIENEDVTWSPQYNMPTIRTNKRRALSLQEMS